jgi:hypothetical protein
MPDHTEYETGARHPVEKTRPDDNEKFSQDAAANKVPPSRIGNSEPTNDFNEKTRHSEGQNAPRSASQKTSGAHPAIAARSKDAKTPEAGRQPGAYNKE